jgi:hypothetical protein
MTHVEAVLNFLKACCVTFASTCLIIQQLAGYPGVEHISGLVIDQLVEAALSATIAERLPFCIGHGVK